MLAFMMKHPIVSLWMLDTVVTGVTNCVELITKRNNGDSIDGYETAREKVSGDVQKFTHEVIGELRRRDKRPIGFCVREEESK